jgi:hypothetical protein
MVQQPDLSGLPTAQPATPVPAMVTPVSSEQAEEAKPIPA